MNQPGGSPPSPDTAAFTRRAAAVLALLLLAAGGKSWGAPPARATAVCPGASPPATYAGAARDAERDLRDLVHRGFPGVTAAVVAGGTLVWSEGAGYADIERQIPACPATMFRIADVARPLTAAALGLLVERHKLDLDAPVRHYVPSLPEQAHPITTRELAGQRPDARHHRDHDPPPAESGGKFSDSTYGWALISAVVEGASGQPFLAYMREQVFEPLGMTRTAPDLADNPDRARFYELDWIGRLRPAPEAERSSSGSEDEFLSSSEDLARFGAAHLRPGFLGAATLELLFTSQGEVAGAQTGYGIGWTIGRDSVRRRVFMRRGSAVGGISALMLYPDQEVVIALVTNVSESVHLKWAPDRMAGYFIKARAAAPSEAGGARRAGPRFGQISLDALWRRGLG